MGRTEAMCVPIIVPIAMLAILRLSVAVYKNLWIANPRQNSEESRRFNYASYGAGARILAYSDHLRSAKGVLQESRELYLLIPCEYTQEWIEFSLSEDIRVEEIEVIGVEMYSSGFSGLRVQGSTTYPATKWTELGQFKLNETRRQSFELNKRIWLRYLRVTFHTLGAGKYYYCTMNRLTVYGSTLMQGLREEMADTQNRATQKIQDYKAFQGSIAPYGTRSSSLDESLRLIANMQHIRQHGLNLKPRHSGAVLYLNETAAQSPYDHWREQSQCDTQSSKTSNKSRGNESASLLKDMTEQVVNTAVKLEAVGDYMSILEQLSLKIQSKIADLDLNIVLIEGQMESLSKQQSEQDNESAQTSEQLQGEISDLKASLYAVTRELEETRGQLMFVGCFAVCNAVFMVLASVCSKSSTGVTRRGSVESTPMSGGKDDRMSFSHMAKDRSRRKKRS